MCPRGLYVAEEVFGDWLLRQSWVVRIPLGLLLLALGLGLGVIVAAIVTLPFDC